MKALIFSISGWRRSESAISCRNLSAESGKQEEEEETKRSPRVSDGRRAAINVYGPFSTHRRTTSTTGTTGTAAATAGRKANSCTPRLAPRLARDYDGRYGPICRRRGGRRGERPKRWPTSERTPSIRAPTAIFSPPLAQPGACPSSLSRFNFRIAGP